MGCCAYDPGTGNTTARDRYRLTDLVDDYPAWSDRVDLFECQSAQCYQIIARSCCRSQTHRNRQTRPSTQYRWRDEVGELRRAFEQMRVSLQGRLQELNRLLVASQGVAASLSLGDALRPILEAVIASGASSARIILVRDMFPTLVETPLRLADGLEQDVYMHLDQQILSLTEEQERLVMATLSRTRGLILDPNLPHPESLIAVALRHENRYYGVLWAAYNVQHVFSESDIRFISTLASQARSEERR